MEQPRHPIGRIQLVFYRLLSWLWLHRWSFQWILFQWIMVFLSQVSFPFSWHVGAVLFLVVAWGSTLMVVFSWASRIPNRSIALVLGIATAAFWFLAGWGLRLEWDWRILIPLQAMALLAFCICCGNWLGGEIEKPSHLIAVAVIGSAMDILSVLGGPSRHISDAAVAHVSQVSQAVSSSPAGVLPPPPRTQGLLLQWGMPGAGIPVPLIGFGDLVFLSLLMAAGHRFLLKRSLTVIALGGGILLALILAQALDRPIPALPFVFLFFLGIHYRSLLLPKRE